MKKLSLLLLVCMISMLAIAQTDSSANQTQQDLSQDSPAGGLTLSPSSSPASTVNLGNQQLGSHAFTPFILTNGGSGTTVKNISASNPYSVYPLGSQDECPSGQFQLPAGAWCIVLVKFQASAAGESPGTLTVTYGANGTQTAYLNATAIYDVTLVPTIPRPYQIPCSLFVGSCTVTLINPWPISLPIAIAVSDLGDDDGYFSLPEKEDNCGTQTSPLASCTLTVEYSGPGQTQGTLTVTTNPGKPTQNTQTLNLLGECRKYGC